MDGLKGFPEAIESIFPQAQVQLCIVHLLRNSLGYVSWKERKAVAAALKPVYTAATAEQAEQELIEFEAQWGSRYPMIGRSWRGNWVRVIPFFQFPEEIRRVIYTTNAVSISSILFRHFFSSIAFDLIFRVLDVPSPTVSDPPKAYKIQLLFIG